MPSSLAYIQNQFDTKPKEKKTEKQQFPFNIDLNYNYNYNMRRSITYLDANEKDQR